MKITEVPMNLMTVPHEWYVVAAISADLDCTYGLAKLFNDAYRIQYRMDDVSVGDAIVLDSSISLIVKNSVSDKPTIDDLKKCLSNLREVCEEKSVVKLAIPKLCCGHNGLSWREVKHAIREEFITSNIFILVCV